ncbi:MAG: RluA family pseudouridine synthase [Deltaproteobacteria bacterium]|nr:RluA family pseudouridine synthase [Deltaproteobacteria bacterium]
MQRTRLDIYLTKNHPQLSRTELKNRIDEGAITVDGIVRKPSYLLKGGEKIEFKRRSPPRPKSGPEEIPLDILYEDDLILVVNKPAGMVVHPAAGNYSGTLVNALMWHLKIPPSVPLFDKEGEGGDLRPGIVHRLDKGTSGVMVVAKTDSALKNLMNQFKKREVQKTYLALVSGHFKKKEGMIDFAIGRDQIHRRKFSSKSRFKREAVTHYKVIREFLPPLSLLEVYPKTGRTHQIRVHLSESGHPIVGDTHYGAKRLEGLTRPFLHAASLKFRHPETGNELGFSASLPEELLSLINRL